MAFGIDTFRSHWGAHTRLLAPGRVSALLPSRDNDLIRLNLDALGVLARGRRRVGDGSQRITVGFVRVDAT